MGCVTTFSASRFRYHLYYASPSDSAHNATRSFVPVGVSFEVEGMGGVYVLYVSRNRSANAGGLVRRNFAATKLTIRRNGWARPCLDLTFYFYFTF